MKLVFSTLALTCVCCSVDALPGEADARAPEAGPQRGADSGPDSGPPYTEASLLSVRLVRGYAGAPPPSPGKDCNPTIGNTDVVFDRQNASLSLTICASDGMNKTSTRQLNASEVTQVFTVLATIKEVPMPTTCVFDGSIEGMFVVTAAQKVDYVSSDMNCAHRTDVKYADNLGSARLALSELATTP